jgi:hypothetical protein
MKSSKINHTTNLWQRYAVCTLALLFIALGPAYASQPTSGVSFAQVSFTDAKAPQKYSHYGQVSIDYTMLYGEGYINVERYENGKAAGWVVKNLPVISGSVLSGFSTMFDLGASGYQSSFAAYVDFSPTPLADDSFLKSQAGITYQLAQAEYPLPAPGTGEENVRIIEGGDGEECVKIKENQFEYNGKVDGQGSFSKCFTNLTEKAFTFAWIVFEREQSKVPTCDGGQLFPDCKIMKEHRAEGFDFRGENKGIGKNVTFTLALQKLDKDTTFSFNVEWEAPQPPPPNK